MHQEIIKSNICIVGAGPAGATASIFLCKMGIAHLIVDASDFPRDKVCGDGLSLNAIRVLNHIDPGIISNEMSEKNDFVPSMGIRFIIPRGKYLNYMGVKSLSVKSLLNKPVFFVAKRSTFDNLLIGKIDSKIADLKLRTKITKIEKNGDTWILDGISNDKPLKIETKLLIGADGDHSVVLKHVGERKIDRFNYAAALRQYWIGIEGLHESNLIEVYFPKKYPFSYFWIFPLPNGEANVGFGMASNQISKRNLKIKHVFEEIIKTDPVISERFRNAREIEPVKGWGIPMSGMYRKAHGNGWLLIGDAASLVCPSSGEGIGTGMISGYIAAQFIERAIRQNTFEERIFENFTREIHKRLKSKEKIYKLINSIPGWLFSTGINIILSNSYVKKWVTKKGFQSWINTAYNLKIKVDL